MSDDKGFTAKEALGFATFAAVGLLLGIAAYQAGGRLSGAGSGAVVASAGAATTPDGQALYVGNCAGCHGGQGQGAVGPAMKPSAAWSDAEFKEAVLHGHAPGGRELKNVMPRFGTIGLDGAPATDAQLQALHKYLGTLP